MFAVLKAAKDGTRKRDKDQKVMSVEDAEEKKRKEKRKREREVCQKAFRDRLPFCFISLLDWHL